MSLSSKPVWLEGMFMRPQHLQQHDRYLDHVMTGRLAGLRAEGWGIRSLVLDGALLAAGRFAIESLEAVMPDGTPVSIPQMPAPTALEIGSAAGGRLVKLVIQAGRPGGIEALVAEETGSARFRIVEQEVHDATSQTALPVPIQVAVLRCRLLIEGEPEDGCIVLPVARIQEIDSTGAVTLSGTYLPPLLDGLAMPGFAGMIRDIADLLKARGDSLAERPEALPGSADAVRPLDLMMLLTVNGAEPLFRHFGSMPGLHPEIIYRAAVQLAGQLATFDAKRRRLPALPPYRHDDLEACFQPVLAAIRTALRPPAVPVAVPIPLQQRQHGIWIGRITDRALLQDTAIILVTRGGIPAALASTTPDTAIKLGPVEVIRDLVNLQLPGIALRPLPAAPPGLSSAPGERYFELDRTGEAWAGLATSAAIAIYPGEQYAGFVLSLWSLPEIKA